MLEHNWTDYDICYHKISSAVMVYVPLTILIQN